MLKDGMSPLGIRRFRAERLLREQFESMRGQVLGVVRARLRAGGVTLDEADLEACYALAWQGLYTAVLDGREIDNPTGWLVLVSYRRAIEEQRARRRLGVPASGSHGDSEQAAQSRWRQAACEPDLAAELDDRARI